MDLVLEKGLYDKLGNIPRKLLFALIKLSKASDAAEE
jgi:hypothetical protein